MDKLQSINTMLSVIGEAPIADITINIQNNDATLALNILDETTHAVQLSGWHFNSEPNVILHCSNDGYIYLPESAGRVSIKNDRNLVQRGNRLYDKDRHTYTIIVPVTADIVYLLEYDELPPTAQYYITIKASRIFQARCLGSETLFKYTNAEEADALRTLKKAEGITSQFNMFRDNIDIVMGLNRC